MELLNENILTFTSISHEKLQEFIVSPSARNIIVNIFDNMY